MNWLRNFMYGRYGFDQLSLALLISSIAISLVGSILGWSILRLLSWAPMIWAWFRILSRNIYARGGENQKFMGVWYKISGWFHGQKTQLTSMKTHKFFSCPNCKQTLRVPKGKGKVNIRCPKCGTEFIKKT